MSLDYAALQKAIIQIAADTRTGVLEIYNDKDRWDAESKSDDSPITAADKYVHECLMAGLTELTPDIPVLSEESQLPSWETRQSWDRYWIIDPLDGTKEFINRTGEFTVNVALIEGNSPTVSVVYVPIQDVTYSAVKGQGAIKIDEEGEAPIKAKKLEAPGKIIGSRSHRSPKLEELLAVYERNWGEYDVTSAGSSLKFCKVAEGSVDLYPRQGLTSEWDTAAAQLVVEEAGGKVLVADGSELAYNTKDDILNPFFMVVGDTDQDWSSLLPFLKQD